MFSRARTECVLLAAGLALAGVLRAESLLPTKSPFLAPQAGGSAAPTAGAPLEYRGTMQTAEGLKARIVDPARHSGAWLRANERDPGFDVVVKQIDVDHDTVTVDYQGRALTLAQHVAKVTSTGAPPMMPAFANPASNMPPAIAQSVVINPTPADEQRRLEAVAAEVARRRQLREQAALQVSQGIPLAPQLLQQNAAQQNNGTQRQRGGQRPRGNQK
jgi:hypothetical protein